MTQSFVYRSRAGREPGALVGVISEVPALVSYASTSAWRWLNESRARSLISAELAACKTLEFVLVLEFER